MSHWYAVTEQGVQPCYETAKVKGGMRPTTLADAKKRNLLPSVTSILSTIAKPELVNWIVQQNILAALTLPQLEGEPLDAFAKRVVEDADVQRNKAAEFGVRIHDAIESWLQRGEYPAADLELFVLPTLEWLDSHLFKMISCEQVLGCPKLGIAGRLDLHAVLKGIGPSVCDFKSQRVREKPAFYFEFGPQIAAYRKLIGDPDAALVSVVIDSGKPAAPHVKVYDDAERHWSIFEAAFTLWREMKSYDPRNQSI